MKLSSTISAHLLCVEKFKMVMRFAEPVAPLEKATPENTKKQLNMELRFLMVCDI